MCLDLTVGTILAHLRAFMLLDPWLRATSFATRIQRVAAPPDFPDDYTRLVLSPDYRPDLAGFADDYLAANPSRDRALDLLPLLLHLDAQRVRRLLPREKISARAVFHYRLPQAHVGDEGWSIAADWNRWVAVERLAADPERLAELSRAWLLFKGEAGAWIARPPARIQSDRFIRSHTRQPEPPRATSHDMALRDRQLTAVPPGAMSSTHGAAPL